MSGGKEKAGPRKDRLRWVETGVEKDSAFARAGTKEEPGIAGAFTRATAPGALPRGTRVRKVQSEEGDAHPVGSMATVIGSVGGAEVAAKFPELAALEPSGIGYFVMWDDMPGAAVFITAKKLAPVE